MGNLLLGHKVKHMKRNDFEYRNEGWSPTSHTLKRRWEQCLKSLFNIWRVAFLSGLLKFLYYYSIITKISYYVDTS